MFIITALAVVLTILLIAGGWISLDKIYLKTGTQTDFWIGMGSIISGFIVLLLSIGILISI